MEMKETETHHEDQALIGRRTASGGTWTVAARVVSRVVDLATIIVLAHILHPGDFGLVAIAMTVIFIVEAALELPISQALVRLPAVSKERYDTAFTLGLIRGLAVGLIVCSVAWPFAHFYKDHRLISLVCCLGCAPASRGFVSPKLVTFSKNLDFSPDFLMEFIGKLAALFISIAIAIFTGSYWAIVAGTITAPTVATIVSYVIAPYRPHLSLSALADFSGFLGWITAAQVIGAVNWQADRLLLGKLVSRSTMGLFTAANDTANVPLAALLGPIMRPLLSAFALVRNDHKRLCRSYETSASAIVVLALPILVGESLVADPAIRLMFGANWSGAAPLLRWLAISLIPSLFAAPLPPLVMAFGKTQIFFKRNLFEICIKLPLVIFGALRFGFMGIIAARGVSEAATVCFCMVIVRRLVGIPIRRQLLGPWRSIVSTAAMAAVVGPLVSLLAGPRSSVELAVETVGTIALGIITYCVALYTLWGLADRPAGLETMVAERVVVLLRYRTRSAVTEVS